MKQLYKQNSKRGKGKKNFIPVSDDEPAYFESVQKFSKRKSVKTPKRPAFDLE